VADPTFLKMRAIETELQRRMSGRYLTRYQLVTFTRVPYRVALRAGEIQSGILADLARVEPLDYSRGVQLVEERLLPLLQRHLAP
jgi:kynurenine 3-monooxygenase